MVTHEVDGTHQFRIYLPHASCVELVGSFTGWKHAALPMTRLGGDQSGWWHTRQPLPEGDHEFSYLVDGCCWMPDYAASGVKRNPFGNWISTLHVPSSPAGRGSRRAEHAASSSGDRFGRSSTAVRGGRQDTDFEEGDLVQHGR